tara:strand:+ start:694 stop:810 length:117 start_codon:yes stop_codon:yes gene_type:complete
MSGIHYSDSIKLTATGALIMEIIVLILKITVIKSKEKL